MWQYCDGDPLTGTPNAGGMKNRDFRPIVWFISKTIQDRERESYYGWRIGNCTRAFELYHFEGLWVILSDLEKYWMTRSITRSFCDSWASYTTIYSAYCIKFSNCGLLQAASCAPVGMQVHLTFIYPLFLSAPPFILTPTAWEWMEAPFSRTDSNPNPNPKNTHPNFGLRHGPWPSGECPVRLPCQVW